MSNPFGSNQARYSTFEVSNGQRKKLGRFGEFWEENGGAIKQTIDCCRFFATIIAVILVGVFVSRIQSKEVALQVRLQGMDSTIQGLQKWIEGVEDTVRAVIGNQTVYDTLQILKEIGTLKAELDVANQTLHALMSSTTSSLVQLQGSTNATLAALERSTNNTLGELVGTTTSSLDSLQASFDMLLTSFGALNQSLVLAGAVYVGSITPFAGQSPPLDWLLCDGREISRTEYSKLFTVIGDLYGAGNGVSTFNLPDLRGRTGIGAGAGPGLTAWPLAYKYGEEKHLLALTEMPSHNHPGSIATGGAHAHNLIWVNNLGYVQIMSITSSFPPGNIRSFQENGAGNIYAADDARSEHTHPVTVVAEGGNVPHNIMQPSLALNFIIYAG